MVKSPTIKRLLKKLRRVLVAITISFIAMYFYLVWDTYESQFYSSQEVQDICLSLNLVPESTFCREVERNNYQTLENAILERYPLNTTTYEELNSNFTLPLRYSTGTCNAQRTVDRNICPSPEQCEGDYQCYVALPPIRARLRVRLNGNGQVQSYSVSSDSS